MPTKTNSKKTKMKKTVKKRIKPTDKKAVRKSGAVKKTASKKATTKKVITKHRVAKKKPIKKTTRKPIVKTTVKKSKKQKAKTKKGVKIKTSSKKLPKKTKKLFITATEEQCFWINNGPVIKNLQDLSEALGAISKDQFIYHAYGDNNDFALWVEYVLLDKECAKKLMTAKTQKTAIKKVREGLKKYK